MIDRHDRAILMRIPGIRRIIEQAERAQRSGWTEEARIARMAGHAKIISDPDRWPYVHLTVKSQPWVTEAAGGQMRFGMIARSNLCEVKLEGGDTRTFASIEELVKVWAVD